MKKFEITTRSLVERVHTILATDEQHALEKFAKGRIAEVFELGEDPPEILHVEEA